MCTSPVLKQVLGGLVGTKLERKMEKKHSSSAQFSALGWFFLLVYQTTK